jgi:hypothetical protein
MITFLTEQHAYHAGPVAPTLQHPGFGLCSVGCVLVLLSRCALDLVQQRARPAAGARRPRPTVLLELRGPTGIPTHSAISSYEGGPWGTVCARSAVTEAAAAVARPQGGRGPCRVRSPHRSMASTLANEKQSRLPYAVMAGPQGPLRRCPAPCELRGGSSSRRRPCSPQARLFYARRNGPQNAHSKCEV